MVEYLFIRSLEACNVNCFMCPCGNSKDPFRFQTEDLRMILPNAKNEGVKYVRFTGGEPLVHEDIVEHIRIITEHGLKASFITNGKLLTQKVVPLAKAGLSQVIISLDGLEETHNRIRRTARLFQRAIDGLTKAKDAGIKTRVNTVVGPHNYKEVLSLQRMLSDMGVSQWELSSLKLGKPLSYSEQDRTMIEEDILPSLFAPESGKLIPFGKPWCGQSENERNVYFETGITPRPDGICHVVDYVRFLDPQTLSLFGCSLLPHRRKEEQKFPVPVQMSRHFSLAGQSMDAHVAYYKGNGPTRCTGCSTTATGFSNLVSKGIAPGEWAY